MKVACQVPSDALAADNHFIAPRSRGKVGGHTAVMCDNLIRPRMINARLDQRSKWQEGWREGGMDGGAGVAMVVVKVVEMTGGVEATRDVGINCARLAGQNMAAM
ncbi:hypothetical protein E2C01_030799 [Portunus trituberculatus]|uniref:Uncharacterized protein n=1 Tax=Portunus trituberculatus TaxID=210409 RepID=A0A5B7EV58_PORTR|nr:hypothetical protein [Portunus trituberculatus]